VRTEFISNKSASTQPSTWMHLLVISWPTLSVQAWKQAWSAPSSTNSELQCKQDVREAATIYPTLQVDL